MAERDENFIGHSRAGAELAVSKLDKGELQILALLVQGESPRSIAIRLGAEVAEIKARQASLMQKLSARTTADAVRLALLAGIDK